MPLVGAAMPDGPRAEAETQKGIRPTDIYHTYRIYEKPAWQFVCQPNQSATLKQEVEEAGRSLAALSPVFPITMSRCIRGYL